MNANTTPEVIEALANLRKYLGTTNVWLGQQLDFLDNAGTFSAIDEASNYGEDPAGGSMARFCNCGDSSTSPCIVKGHPVKASECTCPAIERERSGTDNHYIECPEAPVSKCTCPAQDHGGKHAPACPGDPAEWGDMAYTSGNIALGKYTLDQWSTNRLPGQ